MPDIIWVVHYKLTAVWTAVSCLASQFLEMPDIIWVVHYKLTAVWTAVSCLASQFLEMPDIIWVVHYKLTAVWTAVSCLASQLLEANGGTSCGNGWRRDVLNLGDSHLGLLLPMKGRERLAHYWEMLVPYMPALFMSNIECHTKQQCAHAAVCVMYLAINLKKLRYIYFYI